MYRSSEIWVPPSKKILSASGTVLHRQYPHLAGPAPVPLSALPPPRIELPTKLRPLWTPKRYKVLRGGRGGAKSHGIARTLLVMAAQRKLRILCTRELQNSIADSVHKLLSDLIAGDAHLSAHYEVQKKTIVNRTTGSEFIFAGVRNNVKSIKSMEGIDICWVEEAEGVSDYSWQVLIPTIRKSGSEIWVSFNPDQEDDPTSRRFITNPPDDCISLEIGWQDNPWFPEELRKEMEYLYRIDPEAADHVWGGQFRKNSAAQVLRGKYVREAFVPEPDWDGPYFGADFGYSVDPSTLIKSYIHENRLHISEEAYGVGVEIDGLPAFYDSVSGARKRQIRADSSLPATISYLQRHGYPNVVGATKGPGSVEDGILFLRSFEKIIIHPRCEHTYEEARLWSYKCDRLTKLPTTDLEDKHNHCWDAIRYSMEPIMAHKNLGMLDYMNQLAARKG